MKKVLITGANGFLGSNIARELYKRGYDIRLMIRPAADTDVLADIPCEIFHGNITNARDVQVAVKGCDYVVHTASVTKQWNTPYREYEQVNVTGTKNIADACLQYNVKRLVHVSTANTIGPGNKDKPANELNSFSFVHAGTHYISTKYMAQQYVLEQVARRGLPAVIVNPTFMIGPYDSKPSSGQIILHGMNRRIVFYPPGGKNFIHINDVSTGVANALETGKVGECYLLASENMTYKDFFKLLKNISGQDPLLIQIPGLVLKTLGLAGSLIGTLRKSTVKLNYSSAYMLCQYNYYSGKKAERELKVRYTQVDKAIENALTWFKENKYC